MAIDNLSLATTPVFLLKGNKHVSQGTGFFYLHRSGDANLLFLITNVHVFTGRGPLECEEPIGDNILFQFHKSLDHPSEIKPFRWPLYTKRSQQVWIQSGSVPEADLAVVPIPVSAYEDCKDVSCISRKWMTSGNLKVRPTSPITLIGYPYGYFDRANALPIWKTGSLASEPDVDFDGKPLLILDISAFPGMSGAPAFAVAYGSYETEDGGLVAGGVRRFMGIFASMQMRTERKFLEEFTHSDHKLGVTHNESLQLGHVWKAQLIDELVASVDVEKWKNDILTYL